MQNSGINFAYNVVNQLITKTLPGSLIMTFDYDEIDNLTSVIDPDSNLTFQYDGASRLTTTATTGSPNQPGVTITYTYDLNGNRKTIVDTLNGPYRDGTTNFCILAINQNGPYI